VAWDNIWEEVFKKQEWGKYPGESLIRFVARRFYKKDRKNTKILEIGCGPGANIWYMSREGFDVYGMDASETAINRAKTRLEGEGLKAHLQVGDVIRLPYEQAFFDAVIDVECLCANNITDAEMILKEIKRILKNDGLFYSRTFTEDMYVGKTNTELGQLEYNDVSDGPLSGKGFVRLINMEGIGNLYGKYFNIKSVDKLEYTSNNGNVRISEWVIICQKVGGINN